MREIPGLVLVVGFSLTCLMVAALMRGAGLALGPPGIVLLAVGLGTLAAAARFVLFRQSRRAHRIVGEFIEYAGLFTFVCLAGVIASYPVAYASADFSDLSLQGVDQALGFSWIGWYGVVSAHRSLQVLGRFAYDSIFVTPLFMFGYFAYHGHRARAHLLIASFWLAAILTLLLFHFIPAKGPLAFLWHGPVPYMPISAVHQAALIPALKDHTLHRVSLNALQGLVSAPSFHTAGAFLYILAAWPIRELRWPVLLLNIMMLLAIPIEGTHYLVDMVGGMFVAFVAFWAMQTLLFWRPSTRANYGTRPAHAVGATSRWDVLFYLGTGVRHHLVKIDGDELGRRRADLV